MRHRPGATGPDPALRRDTNHRTLHRQGNRRPPRQADGEADEGGVVSKPAGNERRLYSLQVLRAVAAVAVVFSHFQFDMARYVTQSTGLPNLVIGGGIKSHFLYSRYPYAFPNRSQNALWALYFLTDKKEFGFDDGSEFLMID